LEVGKRHYRRRIGVLKEHWKLVDEVSNSGLRAPLAVVDPRGQNLFGNLKFVAKKADLFLFGFKVFTIKVGQNKIQHSNPALDEVDFMVAPVADVLAVDLAVETAGEQVIDRSAFWKAFGPGVALGLKFVPEKGRTLAPMGVGEGEKLSSHKVARMCRYDVEKPGLGFGVPESF
jgi:hypothetical protein